MNININTKMTSTIKKASKSLLRMLFLGVMMLVMGFEVKAQCTTWLSSGFPATVGSVTITRTAQTRVAVNSGAAVNTGGCGATLNIFNNTTIQFGINSPISTGNSFQTFTFSKPVNDIKFGITAGNSGSIGFPLGGEQIDVSVNNGTSNVIQGANCWSTTNGNTIDFHTSPAPTNNNVGDGIYTLHSTLPYTTVTFTGYLQTRVYLGLCGASIIAAPTCVAPTAVSIDGSNIGYCQNNPATTLNATFSGTATGATYQWKLNGSDISGATGSSYTPPTSSAGIYNYTVTVTNSCGNATSGPRVITVTAPANPGTLSGNQNICLSGPGTTTFTTNGSAGGTWSTGNAAIATVNATTGVITAAGVGTATITYTIAASGGCGAAASTRNVTVTADPPLPALSSTASTCSQAGTTTITNYNATYNYIFTPSGPAAGAGGVITGTTPGTSYTVLAENLTCQGPASASFSNAAASGLNVLVAPSAVVCSGVPATITVSGNTGTVNWTNSYGESGTGTSVSFPGGKNISGIQQTVTYNFIETGSTCSIPTSAVITINPAPSLQVDLQKLGCNGKNTILEATATPATSTIDWTRTQAAPTPTNGSGASPLTVSQALPTGTYNYSFTATGTNGCVSKPIVVPVSVN